MGDRVIVTLGCGECKNKNYYFQRGKKKEFKLEVKKFLEKGLRFAVREGGHTVGAGVVGDISA